WQLGATRPTEQPHHGQSTATIPAGVHVSIVSPLLSDVRHIAVPSPTRSFETLVSRLFRDSEPASRDVRRLHFLGALESWQVVQRGGIRMSHCRFKFEVRWKSPVRF